MKSGEMVGGKYRLGRLLGEGGMGTVWAAQNELIGRDVAIKVMQPAIAKDAEALRRFFNEARICAAIRDPGIVDVLDLGTAEDGSPFMVMELLEGESLETRLLRSGVLGPSEALPILRDVAQSVALAHARGIVHRDLKPANIFLHRHPKGWVEVKVLDFGVSKVMNDSASATRSGAVLGSPAFMSPEQAAGRPIDHTTDIYSIGVVLYEALTGRLPFDDAPNTNALLVSIATLEPASLGTIVPDMPRAVVELVSRAMARHPTERFQSATELALAMDQVLDQLAQVPIAGGAVDLVVRGDGNGFTKVSEGPAIWPTAHPGSVPLWSPPGLGAASQWSAPAESTQEVSTPRMASTGSSPGSEVAATPKASQSAGFIATSAPLSHVTGPARPHAGRAIGWGAAILGILAAGAICGTVVLWRHAPNPIVGAPTASDLDREPPRAASVPLDQEAPMQAQPAPSAPAAPSASSEATEPGPSATPAGSSGPATGASATSSRPSPRTPWGAAKPKSTAVYDDFH